MALHLIWKWVLLSFPCAPFYTDCLSPRRSLNAYEPLSSHLRREVKWCATIMEVFAVKTSKRVFRNTWIARLLSMPIVDRRRPPWPASLTTKTQHNKCTRCLCALLIVVEHIYACNDTDPFCHSQHAAALIYLSCFSSSYTKMRCCYLYCSSYQWFDFEWGFKWFLHYVFMWYVPIFFCGFWWINLVVKINGLYYS